MNMFWLDLDASNAQKVVKHVSQITGVKATCALVVLMDIICNVSHALNAMKLVQLVEEEILILALLVLLATSLQQQTLDLIQHILANVVHAMVKAMKTVNFVLKIAMKMIAYVVQYQSALNAKLVIM